MKERFSKFWDHPSGQVGLLLAVCLCVFFMNLGQWDLWNPDEPRYAQVAREMVSGGDWILMHFNGQLYTDKPPLFFWLVALSSYLWQGFSSFAVRFPSAFFGTLTVLLTFFIGRRLFSSRTGLISALVLATSAEFVYLATRTNIDSTLTFFTTASIFCFLRWYGNYPPHPHPLPAGERVVRSADEEKRSGLEASKAGGLWIYGFYTGMGLATLAKGPVGFLLPLLVCLTFLIVQRDWIRLRKMKFLPGLVLFLFIVGSWYIPALMKGGKQYFEATLLHHSVARFSEGTSHIRPFYYYLFNFPADFLPWFLFLPAAVAYGFSKGTFEKRKEFLFLLAWFAVIFLFFSISKGKRGLYLLPLFPAVSLMVGKLWDDFISSSINHFRKEWVIIPLYAFMGLLLMGGIALSWFVSMKFHSYLTYSLPVTFLAAAGSVTVFILYRFKLHGAVFIILVGIMVSVFFYATRVVFPLADPYNSARTISQEITSRVQPGQKIAIYGIADTGSFNYYTGIVPIVELKRLEHVMAFMQSEGRVYCLLWDRDLGHYQAQPGWPAVEVISRQGIGHRNIVLVSNRKDRP